ncbi:hypothetical protein CC1G_08651 [Coprinopsis cinerea okayama7|uniref:Uncharacterized protein n=1 Tax=Coprinopsis cinerea (strain Okayama-7 / 130 / ATCC MYA-4618 / FGSC 9003) TaxID=240176 RepID=A8N0V4_COPC7|nr:hypothetical protein CC1G_08651 [Coprinopsis cinerea okayama7\|eukprot:XP_001828505.2 hypothetical protein CC1G_08651 [Coprinopsis cinerea okayama7\
MPKFGTMFRLRFRRKELPWEVVDNKFVDPVPTYSSYDELQIDSISDTELNGTYVFDINPSNGKAYRGIHDLHRAVNFSRQQLMSEASKRGFNVLLVESWQLKILRKNKHHRIELLDV